MTKFAISVADTAAAISIDETGINAIAGQVHALNALLLLAGRAISKAMEGGPARLPVDAPSLAGMMENAAAMPSRILSVEPSCVSASHDLESVSAMLNLDPCHLTLQIGEDRLKWGELSEWMHAVDGGEPPTVAPAATREELASWVASMTFLHAICRHAPFGERQEMQSLSHLSYAVLSRAFGIWSPVRTLLSPTTALARAFIWIDMANFRGRIEKGPNLLRWRPIGSGGAFGSRAAHEFVTLALGMTRLTRRRVAVVLLADAGDAEAAEELTTFTGHEHINAASLARPLLDFGRRVIAAAFQAKREDAIQAGDALRWHPPVILSNPIKSFHEPLSN